MHLCINHWHKDNLILIYSEVSANINLKLSSVLLSLGVQRYIYAISLKKLRLLSRGDRCEKSTSSPI